MNKKWNKFLLESEVNNNIDLPSLEMKDSLNMNVWLTEDNIKPEIGSRLIQIALDFMERLETESDIIQNIILTGSLANYNWTEYSDIDLHILLDFTHVNEDIDLVRDYFNTKKADWNKSHQIMIKNHEVEIYVQDIHEPHISTGVYSLLEDQWVTKPNKERPTIDYNCFSIKTKSLMDQINRLEDLYNKKNYEAVFNVGDLLKNKIKRLRRCGLMEKGIFSTENLVFKALRNKGFIRKLLDFRRDAYDKMMSINNAV